MSFPLRERGLKFSLTQLVISDIVVPLAGTWIEIQPWNHRGGGKRSFPLRERGLKFMYRATEERRKTSFPLRERGLKSGLSYYSIIIPGCRSPCGDVD